MSKGGRASGWEGRIERGRGVQCLGSCFASEPLICLVLKGEPEVALIS